MSWTNATRLVAIALAGSIAGAASAGTIVIRASGPSASAYPVGKSLPEGQKISLKAGDTLVLLDAKGTRTLSGAGSYAIGSAARGSASATTFAALISNSGTRQVRTGAVRGEAMASQPRVASLWYVDTTRSGTVCLRDLTRASLWRSTMAEAQTLTLVRVSDGKSVPLPFAAGQSVRSWPVAQLPIKQGADYRIASPGSAHTTTIRIAAFSSDSDAPDDVAAALIKQGCSGQLDVLVEAGKADAATG